jgi:hypothetical protein
MEKRRCNGGYLRFRKRLYLEHQSSQTCHEAYPPKLKSSHRHATNVQQMVVTGGLPRIVTFRRVGLARGLRRSSRISPSARIDSKSPSWEEARMNSTHNNLIRGFRRGWILFLSSVKSYIETGKPLPRLG